MRCISTWPSTSLRVQSCHMPCRPGLAGRGAASCWADKVRVGMDSKVARRMGKSRWRFIGVMFLSVVSRWGLRLCAWPLDGTKVRSNEIISKSDRKILKTWKLKKLNFQFLCQTSLGQIGEVALDVAIVLLLAAVEDIDIYVSVDSPYLAPRRELPVE